MGEGLNKIDWIFVPVFNVIELLAIEKNGLRLASKDGTFHVSLIKSVKLLS